LPDWSQKRKIKYGREDGVTDSFLNLLAMVDEDDDGDSTERRGGQGQLCLCRHCRDGGWALRERASVEESHIEQRVRLGPSTWRLSSTSTCCRPATTASQEAVVT
jgi:hypothetical protein